MEWPMTKTDSGGISAESAFSSEIADCSWPEYSFKISDTQTEVNLWKEAFKTFR